MEKNSDKQKSDMHEHVLREDKKSRVELAVNKIGEEAYNNNNNIKNTTVSRVCHICGKEFSSGKGLGGHLRSHYQKARKEAYVSEISKSEKQKVGYENSDEFSNIRRREIKKIDNAVEDPSHNCRLCPRTFQSDKSLYGHMRWHKERDWRGIEPPADWIYNHRPSSSSSPLSSLSDADQPLNIADSSDRVVNEQKVAVDLTEGLVGWKVTARRGREALSMRSSSSEISSLAHDPQLTEAADILVLMSSGAFREIGCASKIDRYSAEIRKGKKIELNDVEETGIVLGESVSKINGDLEGFKSTKKRKVDGFCGSGSSGAVKMQKTNTMHTFRTRDEPPGKSDECCNVAQVEEEKEEGEEEEVEVKVRSSHKHNRLLDLNEPPPLEDGGGNKEYKLR